MKDRDEANPSSQQEGRNQGKRPDFPVPDESARETEPIEWWFVQGEYAGRTTGKRRFMASLFRFRISADDAPPENGFSLLLSVLDPVTGQKASSKVDSKLVDWVARKIDDYREADIEPALIDIFQREALKYGPPRPIELVRGEPSLTKDPLAIILDDYSFRQTETGFELEFAEPQSRRVCRFRLTPEVPRKKLLLQKEDGTVVDTVCHTYPSLRLEGTVEGRPVKGEG